MARKRPVRSENMALLRSSDGGRMRVCRIVVGSSWSSYWSSDSEPTFGGPVSYFSDASLVGDWPVLVGMWPMLVGRTSCAGGRLVYAGERWVSAGERWACDRVEARTSCAGKDCAGELGEA